ncbi:TetR/AcrR family transcriptional regulator [Amycolatopsis sp. WQ 127309]|uniref:TetR/AcrR family transcriptional regulator n=1 Tax=Amycolatopsis sp. WQ 127309 TaxID=2932773 RepID=UPI001FF6EBE8|nr:TetR/AcrR family transcriptional regulator [Amycolatopsis sp. WQ 127309]UOZ08233.1 TetR/AcrR family transcriptional regulator [Amycolatopsis sp. WQ 127309]
MTRARGADRRTSIVRAAFEVIAERGYRATSLAAVADRVGLTQQGLMHYFPTKEDLLTAVLETRDEWDLLHFGRDSSAMTVNQLADLVDYNATRKGIVQTYTVLAADSVTDGHPARSYFQDRYTRVRAGMTEMLERHRDELPPGSTPEQLAPLAIAVLDGLQLQWLLAPEEVDMSAGFRTFLTLLGIKPD